MSLELNKINENYFNSEFELAHEVMDKFYPQYKHDKEIVRTNHRIANSSGVLGRIYYQQEDASKSRKYLKLASEALANEIFHEEKPQIIEHTRTPWIYIKAIELAVSFGNKYDIDLLTSIEDIKFIHGTPEHVAKCKLLAYTAFALRAFLKSGSIESSLLTDLVALSESKNVNREEKHFIVPVVHGLQALLEEDKNAWDASVQEALDAHLKEVKSGDYRDDVDGFICMPGMMLIKLGADKGWQSTIDSLYLPKQLMELS